MRDYGKELILDLHDCNPDKFTRKSIKKFFIDLCNKIDMQAEKLSFWDYEGQPEEYAKAPKHLKGISAVQFISTSSIVIHSLDDLNKIFINIFSCKNFDPDIVKEFVKEFFEGQIVNNIIIDRI